MVWIKTDGWRGYEQAPNAVAGSSDTGMWSDSPAKTVDVDKELSDFQKFLSSHGIKSRQKATQSSNAFMVKRWVVVAPGDIPAASKLFQEYTKSHETSHIHEAEISAAALQEKGESKMKEKQSYKDKDEIADAYVAGKKSGHIAGNRMFIEGDTIYSYGHHYPIATRINDETYIINQSGYSHTTAAQTRAVESAIRTQAQKANKILYASRTSEVENIRDREDKLIPARAYNIDYENMLIRMDKKAALKKGIKVEKEHTTDEKEAEKIALDHLRENPDYYKDVQLGKGKKEKLVTVSEKKIQVGDTVYGKALLSSPDTPYHKKLGVVKKIEDNNVWIETADGKEAVYGEEWLTTSKTTTKKSPHRYYPKSTTGKQRKRDRKNPGSGQVSWG